MSIKKKLKRLLSARSHKTLKSDEKASMRREMHAYMDMYPIRNRKAEIINVHAPFYASFFQPSYAVLGLAVATIFTMGASELSLPNDSLYAVKTGFNERVLLASTYFSPVLHAEAEHTVFARRLEEAEQLMLLEQFKSETADEVQASIDAHAEAVDRSIARAEAAGKPDRVEELRAELVATREEYEPLLNIIALRKEVENTEIIDKFIEEIVHEHAGLLKSKAAREAFHDIEYKIMTAYANQMLSELEALNKSVTEGVSKIDQDLKEAATEAIVDELAASNASRAEAEAELRNKNPEAALDHLEAAILSTKAALTEIGEITARESAE